MHFPILTSSANPLHALSYPDVLGPTAPALSGKPLGGEPAQRLLGKHVACFTRNIVLLHVGLELEVKVDRVSVIVGLKHVSQVLDNHVGVIVCLQEPVSLIEMVFVQIEIEMSLLKVV